MTQHVLSYSGGKDSTAMLLLAVERRAKGLADNLTAVFADTGHEHPQTLEYVQHISETVYPITTVRADFSRQIARKRGTVAGKWRTDGVPEERVLLALETLVPTGIPFLDMCLVHGRFPSTRARFCSSELKHFPVWLQIQEPLLGAGHTVVTWQGIRRDESGPRRFAPPVEEDSTGMIIYRPLVYWTAEDVFAMHSRHGVLPNPLYSQGMGRVGCMPCIHATKGELREIARRFPEEFERVATWERLVSEAGKRGVASFFAADKTPRGAAFVGNGSFAQAELDGRYIAVFGIEEVRKWALTGKGGRQSDLFSGAEDVPVCSSLYGLCE